MRDRIEDSGIEDLHEHEVLEYLLYCCVPRKDTNELAHRLLDEFGSLCDVMNANPTHLEKVSGMTRNASLFLSSLPEIFREYVVSAKHKKHKVVLDSPAKTIEYMGGLFTGLDEERVYAVALDVNRRVIGEKKWTSGKRAQVDVTPQQILDFATRTKAISVLIAHNHPSGGITPSYADIDLTERIWSLLELTGYKLDDHMIFNDAGEHFSFWQSGKFKEFKGEPNL
ncbi:MAG: hypothetical protein NC037_02770 [Bacteroides sp.]|nr:hypothetical protein [Bacillota bacterium]MCM1393342.1 hypothetical protein [[Eubacterium] siraeum]MCM1455436.1 hypothetical protein [Bacteroides sp.]